MHFVELAVQGVRGFSGTTRVALRSGYLALKPPGAELSPLAGLISALCFSDGRGGDVSFLAPGQKTGKAALMLVGNDQTTYRVFRELGGAGTLHRVVVGGQPELVSQDAAEVGQFLRTQVGLPVRTALEQVFFFSAAQFPSRRPKPKAAAPSGSGPKPSLASAEVAPMSSEEGAAKLAGLRNEYALAKEIDELQFKLDGVSQQMFELERQLQVVDGLQEEVTRAEQAYEAAPSPENLHLPTDIVTRCYRFPQLVQRRDEALAKLQSERGQAGESLPLPSRIEPFFQDPRFLGGAVAGALFLLGGMLLSGYARYLALLDIPAFGFAALVALKYVEDLQGSSTVSRKGDFLAAREKKIQEDFEAGTAAVKQALSVTKSETIEELLETLGRKATLLPKVEQARAQMNEKLSDPAFAEARSRYDALKVEQDDINTQLTDKGGYVRDVRELEREMGKIQEAVAKAKNPAPAEEKPVAAAAAGGAGVADPMPLLLSQASDLFMLDVPGLVPVVQERCAQYVSALTDRRYAGVDFDREGKAVALGLGKRLPMAELPPGDVDLLYLSVRLTLIEKYLAKYRVPLVVEDAFTGVVDAAKAQLLSRMLKHLGTLTQVLHVSAQPTATALADATVAL